jgi:hypothetical protein
MTLLRKRKKEKKGSPLFLFATFMSLLAWHVCLVCSTTKQVVTSLDFTALSKGDVGYKDTITLLRDRQIEKANKEALNSGAEDVKRTALLSLALAVFVLSFQGTFLSDHWQVFVWLCNLCYVSRVCYSVCLYHIPPLPPPPPLTPLTLTYPGYDDED